MISSLNHVAFSSAEFEATPTPGDSNPSSTQACKVSQPAVQVIFRHFLGSIAPVVLNANPRSVARHALTNLLKLTK